jgi:hypothetical protein
VAYHRAGDAEEVVQAFKSGGLRTEVRVAGYRSIHHVISCSPGKKASPVEIQIRTVFEEAWAEIDHIVRYPRKTDDRELAGFLKLFNSFAGTADDMGTYLMTLRRWLSDHKELVERERKRADKLEAQVARLQISERERKSLQAEITALRTAPAITPPVFVSTNSDFSPSGLFGLAKGAGWSQLAYLDPVSETVKSCPNGHVFKGPSSGSYVVGGSRCPICNVVVS